MRSLGTCLVVVALILIAGGTPLHGEYMVPEIEQVPVVRLIANFERRSSRSRWCV